MEGFFLEESALPYYSSIIQHNRRLSE